MKLKEFIALLQGMERKHGGDIVVTLGDWAGDYVTAIECEYKDVAYNSSGFYTPSGENAPNVDRENIQIGV